MSKVKDLAGQRFGRLVVVERVPHKTHETYWECKCDCGQTKRVTASHLIGGDTASCGCLKKEKMKTQFRTHGATEGRRRSREYDAWRAMHDRCNNKDNPAYKDYGARGITICDRWQTSFENFLADMGQCPTGHTTDRKDNNGGYSPDNCRWATSKEQNNNRRDNVLITYKDVTMTVSQWADRTGLKIDTIRQRITKLKWPVGKALTTPARRSI